MTVAHEPEFNWELLRQDVHSYMNRKHMSRKDFAYACDIDPALVHGKICNLI